MPVDSCPDETEIAEFVQGALDAARAERLEQHIDACAACREVLTEFARVFEQSRSFEPEPSVSVSSTGGGTDSMEWILGAPLVEGSRVGRYRVIELVGSGGMGVVYSAHDPELDRRIALKLLRGRGGGTLGEERSARLLREAQTLARLNHPNVITVHDVGVWQDQVFMAMELVDGSTLRDWMDRTHDWSEIAQVLVAAGRGLQAAHEVGLVHRDFKPDNVLIGKDGRVRVTDFGLARWGRSPTSTTNETARTGEDLASAGGSEGSARPSDVTLTRTGVLVGTPAYMAPEQLLERRANAASDQFSFCVVLFEALHGRRPFTGASLPQLTARFDEGSIPTVAPSVKTPRAVRLALQRGLSIDVARRFGSMAELLDVLEGSTRRRRGAWVLGALTVAVGAGLWTSGTSGGVDAGPGCSDAPGLQSTWDDERREAIQRSFVVTGLPHAEDAARHVGAKIEAYVERWEALWRSNCEGDVRADDGPAVVALRERCLERRRASLDAVIEAMEGADEAMVMRAASVVASLPSLDDCADRETLVSALPPPPPAGLGDDVESVRTELARADGLRLAGEYDQGLDLAQELDARAEALDHAPLRAETLLMLGRLRDLSGEPEEALLLLEGAGLRALSSHHYRVLADARIDQVYVVGSTLADIGRARRVARRAEAAIEAGRLGNEARFELLLNQGTIEYRDAHYEESERFILAARALVDEHVDPMRWATATFNLASLRAVMGLEERAVGDLRDCLEIYEVEYGASHPEVGQIYNTLAVILTNMGRTDEARAAASRAVEIRRAALGPKHRDFVDSMTTLGMIINAQAKPREALPLLQTALETGTAAGFLPHELTAARVELATAMLELGRVDDAEQQVLTALEAMEARLGPSHPDVAEVLGVLARVASRRGEPDAVRRHMDRAQEIRREGYGPEHPDLMSNRIELGLLLVAAGDVDAGEEHLRRLLPRLEGHPDQRFVEMGLADVKWRSATDEERAALRELVEAMLAADRAQGSSGDAFALSAREWLVKHPAVDP